MLRNDTHPIRATITIIWKKKYKQLKKSFEKNLEGNIKFPSSVAKKKEILRLAGEINNEFLDKYSVGEFRSKTAHDSYIIRENLGDQSRTSIDIFNCADNIKLEVKHIIQLLKNTIKNDKKCFFVRFKYYSISIHYSINSLQFKKITLGRVFVENIPLLLGWFIAPIITVINSDNKNINTLDILNNYEGGALSKLIDNFSLNAFIVSILIIMIIYISVSLMKYFWENKNEIRI
jgi:hypothetical protein